jgi:alkylhydroperoxidase family enzyme
MSGKGAKKGIARITTIGPAAATGDLAELYSRLGGSRDPAHIYQVHSLNPPALAGHVEFYRAIMFRPSPLSRLQRELVATVVSHDNGCHY